MPSSEPVDASPKSTYWQPEETSENLDWADLVTLDFSKFDEPGGKQQLATELYEAVQKTGFFYVRNFGLTPEEINRQYSLGHELLSLPIEEKSKYKADLDHGDYNRFKPAGTREVFPGIRDNFEIYNVPKFTDEFSDLEHPQLVKENWNEIESFSKTIHEKIVQRILILLAHVLDLDDENYFIDRHRYGAASGDHLRYMTYYHRTTEENEKLGGLWLKGHSDMGSLTILFRQPVAALQVLTPEGFWKWVKPQQDAVTVNLADALQFLTGGFLKSSIHRVVAPPKDQAHIDRLGVLYMVRPEDDLDLALIKNSPVLKRLGYLVEGQKDSAPLKAGEWVKARVIANLGNTSKAGGDFAVKEVEILPGVKTTYFD